MGLAIGEMGLALDDLRRMTVAEFEATYERWNAWRETLHREEWERMRLLATIVIQPHTKKRITPKQLLPLPWDKKLKANAQKASTMSSEEHRQRFLKRIGRKDY